MEVYTDNAGTVLGSIIRHNLNGAITEEEKSGSIYSFEYDMVVPSNDLIYEGTETVTVHAGTFVCDKYFKPSIQGSRIGNGYFISPQIPVPIKVDYDASSKYSFELWG